METDVSGSNTVFIKKKIRARVQKGSEVTVELTFDNRDNRTLLLLAFGITDSCFGLNADRELLYEKDTVSNL